MLQLNVPADGDYSLEELSDLVSQLLSERGLVDAQTDHRVSSVPDARTIRYYTTLGLLDRPTVAGRQARYGPRHVLQLLAIKTLQGMSLPLAEVQQRLYGRSNKELTHLLETLSSAVRAARIRKPEVVPVVWREVTIEPGLKISVEADWQSVDPDTLAARIAAAIEALQQ
jgi:DNA-binding transcriptional MerR regulator